MSPLRKILLGFLLLNLIAAVARAEEPICQVLLNRHHRGEAELVLNLSGEPSGHLRYRMLGKAEAAVTGMFMYDAAKGKGLSSALVHGMMLRNPDIRKVGALLVMTNLSASGLLWVKQRISDDQCYAAVQNTPFVKVFKKFGFDVVECYWNPDAAYLEIEMNR